MKNEQKFYDALHKIFSGAKIHGEGGFINLLAIKSTYFKKFENDFKKLIDDNQAIYCFKEDFFNHLFSFFDRYFNECGSVFFVKTAA